MRPVGLYVREMEGGHIYFFFLRQSPNLYDGIEGQRSANSRREIITRTGHRSFVTKVLFFYSLTRERGKEGKPDASRVGCNPHFSLLFFSFFLPAGGNDAKVVTRRITQIRVLTRRRQYRRIAIIFTAGFCKTSKQNNDCTLYDYDRMR